MVNHNFYWDFIIKKDIFYNRIFIDVGRRRKPGDVGQSGARQPLGITGDAGRGRKRRPRSYGRRRPPPTMAEKSILQTGPEMGRGRIQPDASVEQQARRVHPSHSIQRGLQEMRGIWNHEQEGSAHPLQKLLQETGYLPQVLRKRAELLQREELQKVPRRSLAEKRRA